MSLTSLADAPLLAKPLAGAGSVLPKSRCLSAPNLKDQAAIDALFEEDNSTAADLQIDTTQHERKSLSYSRELLNSERKKDLKRNTADETHKLHFATLPPLIQQTSDIYKKKLPKQEDSLFSKTRDANDVLAGFLADSTSSISSSRPPSLEAEKEQREEFKSRWDSYSPQPATQVSALNFSPRIGSESIQHSVTLLENKDSFTKQEKDLPSLLKKDGDWISKDVLSLLSDESTKPVKEDASTVNSSLVLRVPNQDVEEDSLDFGGYQPSCLSMSSSTQVMQQRHLTNFFSLSENMDSKGKRIVADKCEKNQASSFINNTSDQIEMLKTMHKQELEMKERQLTMQEAFLVEKKGAMEAISQLLLKADGWSARIDELQRNIVCDKGMKPSALIGNIENMVSEHECSLQMLEKRSTDVCNQLESVVIMLDNARKDMEKLQKQEEERTNKTHSQLQGFQDLMQREHDQTLANQSMIKEKPEQIQDTRMQEQQRLLSTFLEEKKDFETERETVLCMKEQLLEADAMLRKQLHEHAVRMKAEAEEMSRQKRELEHAKNIAAEIVVEVESSQRELNMFKTVFNRVTPEAQHEEKSLSAHLAAQKRPNYERPNYERSLELIRRCKFYRRPYSSGDTHSRFAFGFNFLDDCKSIQSGVALSQEFDEETCYLRSQEEFLIEAEVALKGMPLDQVCAS